MLFIEIFPVSSQMRCWRSSHEKTLSTRLQGFLVIKLVLCRTDPEYAASEMRIPDVESHQ